MSWIKRWFCGKDELEIDLIDLQRYEETLLYNREHGQRPVPVRPIATWTGATYYTPTQLSIMRDNRERAQAIKKRIFREE